MKTKHFLLFIILTTVIWGCEKEDADVAPNVPIMVLLSGGNDNGKTWIVASSITTSNVCSIDKSKPLTTDNMLNWREALKDNSYTILPSGEVIVDDGEVRNLSNVRYYYGQTWTLLDNDERVEIFDPVGQPSFHGTPTIYVTKDNITLKFEQRDPDNIQFSRSFVVFKPKSIN